MAIDEAQELKSTLRTMLDSNSVEASALENQRTTGMTT